MAQINPPGGIPPAGGGDGNGTNGGTPAPAGKVGAPGAPPRRQGRGRQGQGGGQNAGIGGGGLAGPGGRQLAARVSSGAITQEQAQKTMQQRQTLAKALGPDWREKLSVGGKSFAQVNAGLKKNPGNPKLAALRKKLIANRSSLLDSAREKNGGREAGKTEGGE